MAKIDAKLHSKGLGGETITTTIGYISPNATNTEIKTFAQMLNGITNNVYDNTDKVTTVNCDTEDDKPTPTLKLMTGNTGGTEATTITGDGETNYNISYNGDGEIYVRVKGTERSGSVFYGYYGNAQTMHRIYSFTANSGVVFEFHATETNNYKAVTAEYTVA